MLRNIPKIIDPDLMKYLMEMGHSDKLLITDANFPAKAHAKRFIRMDSVEITDLLTAILPYYPLDNFVEHPVSLMKNLPSEPVPEIWECFRHLILKFDEEKAFVEFTFLDRLPFYELAADAYVVVQTGTTSRYANIILQKGVL